MAKEERKFITSYKGYKAGVNDRINFSKISGSAELPNLVEIQTESYKWFKEKGLDEVLRENFPIKNFGETITIDYVSCRFEEPVFKPLECKANGSTYSSKLKVKLTLSMGENVKEAEVFMGDLPLMTDSGTFIINGDERVIVSQIVRSPGAYFQDTVDKSGLHMYNGEIIPSKGTWLQFESDAKGVLWVRIDRQRKMPAVVLFKGILNYKDTKDNEKLLKNLFGNSQAMLETLKKDKDINSSSDALKDIFKKLKPGEPMTEEGVHIFLFQKFFDDKRYYLGMAGRYKYNGKLGLYERLPGRVLAEKIELSTGEVFEKDHKLTKADVQAMRDDEYFENGNKLEQLPVNEKIDSYNYINCVSVYAHDKVGDKVCKMYGVYPKCDLSRATIPDMVACFSYFCNIQDGLGNTDDIDHLANRRIKCVGELLQAQFGNGLAKMAKAVQSKMTVSDMETLTAASLINIRPLTLSIREFFSTSQLSQFMDQVNPLSGLTNKRRISALGPGALTRDRASMEVRDVHYTHYGRICPIETPEGQNIGLINNLATYAKINKYGFVETPYRSVVERDGEVYVSEQTVYLSADAERGIYIAEANIDLDTEEVMINGYKARKVLSDKVVARFNDENILVDKSQVAYVDVSPKQIVAVAASCIPFLEHDDATRALMGSNMQRQALPLLRPSIPYVGTGMEQKIAADSGLSVVAVEDGKVTKLDSTSIFVKEGKQTREYKLQKFDRSNQSTCINQSPIVKVGQEVKKGQIIADGPAMRNGELALGQNILVAYMTWNGYNYEDAVIMSERMVKEDTFTTIHIEKYDIECRDTKLGPEEITRDIPNVGEDAKTFLDENGIIIPGAEVKEGDILVGKVTPKGQTEPTPEEKFLMAIFGDKTKEGKDSSLRVPHGGAGIVHAVKVFSKKKKDPLQPGVRMAVRVYIVQKRKISEGDKMSGRHGNKGVISKILPIEDMPFLPDGTPIDVMLSPMGVPSRMNIGQILEIHLGLACHKLGMRVATPVFDGISNDEIADIMKKAGIASDGKAVLYDGRTGERFDERISVGVQYMIKLVHMVDDKLHARAIGPYSLVTQQPLGGKAQKGGQRFGEMEVWALEAYGAAHVLQEMLTIKSDDRVGRAATYEAIIKGEDIPTSGLPEAFKVLVKEFRGLGMNPILYTKEGTTLDMDKLAEESLSEERKINSAIRHLETKSNADKPTDEEESVEIAADLAGEEGLTIGTNPSGLSNDD